ncbi:MAG: histidine triad nucleotide-binding protein [Clostridia bacterium]|nr:histidine triad nucleotide-binding protein [Clostridia bacterium]
MADCIFCKLANGEIPTKMIFENDKVACFADANPQAPVHVLVLPKCHIESADGITPENSDCVKAVFEAIPQVADKLGIKDNYRVINNCGEGAGQSVKHLHFHIVSGDETLKARLF